MGSGGIPSSMLLGPGIQLILRYYCNNSRSCNFGIIVTRDLWSTAAETDSCGMTYKSGLMKINKAVQTELKFCSNI
jgi:hypothetical protein